LNMILESFDKRINITNLSIEQPETADISGLVPAKHLNDKHWDKLKVGVLDQWRNGKLNTKAFLSVISSCYIIDRTKAEQILRMDDHDIAKLNEYMGDSSNNINGIPYIKDQANYLILRGAYHDNSPDLTGARSMVEEAWTAAKEEPDNYGTTVLANLLADLKILMPPNVYVTEEMWTFLTGKLQEFIALGYWDTVADLASSMRLVDEKKYAQIRLTISSLRAIEESFVAGTKGGALIDTRLAEELKILAADKIDFSNWVPEFIMPESKQKHDPGADIPPQRNF
jgi:hypothetical protein